MSSQPDETQVDDSSEAIDSGEWGFRSTKPAPPLSTDQSLELSRGVRPAPDLTVQSIPPQTEAAIHEASDIKDLVSNRPQKETPEPQDTGSE